MAETQKEATTSKAVQFVKERHSASKVSSSLDFERFANYYKLFRNKQTKKNYTGLANLFIPEPYRIVRRKTAKLATAIRSIKVKPETAHDIEAAKIGSQLLNFLRTKLDWWLIERSAVQESRTVGLAWIKAVWLLDKEEEKKPYKGFDLSMETADRVFLPPGATMLDVFAGNLEGLVHEYQADYETIAKNGNYKKDALLLLKLRAGAKEQPSVLAQARQMFNRKQNETSTAGRKKHNIKEYWGKYSKELTEAERVEGKQVAAEDYIIVVADDTIELRCEKNPYADILDNPLAVFIPIIANLLGEETYPVGDIEPAESLFNELNDTRNQRMDTVTFNIDPPKEVLKGANIDKKQLVAKRGWFFESSIPNGVRFIPPDMQGVVAATNEEKIIRGDIQQVTGILDFSQDSDVQSGVSIDTARGAVIAKGEADVLTVDEIELVKVCLRMLYRTVLAFSQHFLDRNFSMSVVEKGVESFVDVDKSKIQGNLDLDIEMRTLQDRTTEQQMKLMFLNLAKTVPGAKLGKFFTDALEAFYDDVQITEYYEDPQPPQPEGPKISISLKGDLNESEVDEIYKTIPGVDPVAADPLMRPSLRDAMRGKLPEMQIEKEMQPGTPTKTTVEAKT